MKAKSILMVMLGTFSSRILGFGRNAVIAYYFGAGAKADVLNFIQAVPMLLRRLAAEGSLETALVPELSRSRERDPSLLENRAIWRKLLAIQWSIIFPLCLVLVLFPTQIIRLLTDFPDPQQEQLASRMLYLVSPYVFLLSQSVLLGALLSSARKFTLAAFTPLLSSVAVISSIVFLQAIYGVYSTLIGMLAGIILQLVFLLPPVWRNGYKLLPDFRLKDQAVKRICQIWVPLWFSTSILAAMQFVANYLASKDSSGSISALTNALIFFQLPQGLIYASIAKVCLPQLSLENERVGQVLRYGIGQLVILLLPATLLLALLSEPLIAVAFQRGAFQLQNSLLTAEVLRFYALGTLPVSLFRFLQQYLYARSSKLQPLFQAFLLAAIDIPLSFFLVNSIGLGVIALPIANTISYVLVSLYSFFYLAAKDATHKLGLLRKGFVAATRILPRLALVLGLIIPINALLSWLEQYYFAPNWPSSERSLWHSVFADSWRNLWNSLQIHHSQTLEQAQRWWWSSGGSLRNFAILAVHGLILCLCLYFLCRLLRIPVLDRKL